MYGYIAGISEEDQKRGKAAGDVVMYVYRGVWDSAHRLERVDDAGRVLSVSECSVPCVAIKTYVEGGSPYRLAYNPASVIGAAFEDAITGRLESPKPKPKPKPEPPESEAAQYVESSGPAAELDEPDPVTEVPDDPLSNITATAEVRED